MWNIGNGDPVAGVDPTSDDAYDGMGQTWSVPAVGKRDQAPVPNPPEWRVWVGSGCGDDPSEFEGKCFFMLNAVTGENEGGSPFVVGDGNTHSLPRSPRGRTGGVKRLPARRARRAEPLARHVTRIYIPDLHGRIRKFKTASGGMVGGRGPGAAVRRAGRPDEAGRASARLRGRRGDRRVPDTNPFKMIGYQDFAADGDSRRR